MCDAQPKETPMAKSPYVHENLPDDDEVLRDGQTMRVPMMMRDGVGFTDSLAQHRPGQRFSVDAAARARVEQARAEGIKEMCDAWKNPPDVRGQQPGDQCTINGAPGHLNHRLECIPDKRQDSVPVHDAAAGQRIKDEAYAEMCRELTEAWKR